MLRARKSQGGSNYGSEDATLRNDDDSKRGSMSSSSSSLVSNQVVGLVVAAVFLLGFLFVRAAPPPSPTAPTLPVVVVEDPKNHRHGAHLADKSLLSAQEDQDLLYDASDNDNDENTKTTYHVIFSTDCSPFQQWQSYVLFYRAMKVRQPGHVTRIVSGCNEEEAQLMHAWFDEHIAFMSSRFHIHLTPMFSQVTNEAGEVVGDYKFFNKPFGLQYWLQHSPLLQFDPTQQTFPEHVAKNNIVILIDPDMSILRPITRDFSNPDTVVIGPARQGDKRIATRVEVGKPFGQTYGFGAQFLKLDMEKIVNGDKSSPLLTMTKEEGRLYYPAGPPYLGTVQDMYAIANKWTEFVPRVHEQYPHLLAEMFAYCLAAAHLQLRHQIVDSLMVSDSEMHGGEGWPLIDVLDAKDICHLARTTTATTSASLPQVAHFCQRYSVGEDWFFGKRKIPHDVFDCPSPLFEEPPDQLATLYDYRFPPNGKKVDMTPQRTQREAFMICHLTSLLNEASTFYKSHACQQNTKPNFDKSKKVADLFRERKKKHK